MVGARGGEFEPVLGPPQTPSFRRNRHGSESKPYALYMGEIINGQSRGAYIIVLRHYCYPSA